MRLKGCPLYPIKSEKGFSILYRLKIIVTLFVVSYPLRLSAFTANKVWFEFMDTGQYKVVVNYTIPELKEFRESYVIFNIKQEAEAYFWALVRGADFLPGSPPTIKFKKPKLQAEPW